MTPTAKRTVIAIVAATLAIAAYCAYSFNQKVRNSYAVWWAADMIIEHMIANDNQWPTSWEDLHDDYQTCVKRSGEPWTFDEIRTRVSIDFTVNGKELTASAETLNRPAFRVIWLSDGTESHLQSHEPNTMILNYLKSTTTAQPVLTGFGSSGKG